MSKHTRWKDNAREIKKTFTRFLSIFSLIALGVFSLTGLKITSINMKSTAKEFYDKNNLADLYVQSNWGLDNTDIDILKKIPGISNVEYEYFDDLLAKQSKKSYRLFSLTNDISKYEVVSGILPQNNNEIALNYLDTNKYQMNQQITFMDDNDLLKNKEFKIVGFVKSVELTSKNNLGFTNIGTGQLDSYGVIKQELFKQSYYQSAKISISSLKKLDSYSQEYLNQVETYKKSVEVAMSKESDVRLQEKKDSSLKSINKSQAKLNKLSKEIKQKEKDLKTAKNNLIQNEILLENKTLQLNKSKRELNNSIKKQQAKIDSQLKKINEKEKLLRQTNQLEQKDKVKIEATKNKIASEQTKLNNYKKTKSNDIKENEKELKQNKTKLTTQKNKLEIQSSEFSKEKDKQNKKIKNELYKLNNLEDDILKLKKPTYTLFDRQLHNGYVQLQSNSERIEILANVLPVFLFLVAALVSLTTMSRFVYEQRINMGVYKALGYSSSKIITKFILYGFLATLLGVALGTLLGHTLLANIIFKAYASILTFDKVILNFSWKYTLIALVVSLICVVGSTYLVARKELEDDTSALLLPKISKAGAKIFLEYLTPIWNFLSFTHKVTFRNIFRYKQRSLMTIIGISGCAALLVTGFSLNESLINVANQQFEEITKYDLLIKEKQATSNDITNKYQEDIKETTRINNKTLTIINAPNFTVKNITLIASTNQNDIKKMITLRDYQTKDSLKLDDSGAIISAKLAQNLNVHKGDTIKLKDGAKVISIKISGIADFYIYHYIFLDDKEYEKVFNEGFYNNAYLINLKNDSKQSINDFSQKIMKEDNIAKIVQQDKVKDNIKMIMKSLNSVIVILTVCATLLALIVNYTLVNINYLERIKEISTIKVLGFFNRDVTLYIYRETFILTIIGISIGCYIGVLLNDYILAKLPPDDTIFSTNTSIITFILTIAIILAITLIVSLVLHYKIKKLEMVSALQIKE